MRIILCLAMLSSSVAVAGHGDGVAPVRVGLGVPAGGRIDRAAITARSHLGHLHVTLAVDLSSRARDATEVSVPLRVSSTASVIGLALGADDGKMLDAEVARGRYDETVRLIRDPALLEQKAPGRLSLAVFPVARGAGARVTIELALPHGAPLLLDGVRTATLDLDGRPRRLAIARPVSLGAALEEERDEVPGPLAVDAKWSLFAVPPQFDVSRPPPVPDLAALRDHRHVPLMPTVSISERVRVRPIREEEPPRPIRREIEMF